MTHTELVNVALGVNGPLLAGVVMVFYKYGFSSELFSSSKEMHKSTLRLMRIQMGSDLLERMKVAFKNAHSIRSQLLDSSGKYYTETPVDPEDSEAFWDFIRDFVGNNAGAMADYRSLNLACERWGRWAERLSWFLLLLLIWQGVVVGSLAIIDKLCGVGVPDVAMKLSAGPTGILLLLCLTPLPILLHSRGRILGLREKYNDL